MPTPPLDLVEYEGRPPFADYKPVCMDTYIKSYKKRWAFRTSIGDVILKKLGQMDRDRISTEYFESHPEAVPILEEARRLHDFERQGINLNEEHMAKLEGCGVALRDMQRGFSLACFEEPRLQSLEEYDAFLSALQPEEVTRLYMILGELASSRPATASCEVLLLIAKEYGIKISEGLTLENMTAEQADILVNTLEKKGELLKREMEKVA